MVKQRSPGSSSGQPASPSKSKASKKALEHKPGSLRRGEVWSVALDPTLGSEIKKTRPCLIISPAEIHDYLRTALAAPMTTGGSAAPFRIRAHFQGKSGLILLDQIRALDKQRLVQCLGMIDAATLSTTLARLRDMFAE